MLSLPPSASAPSRARRYVRDVLTDIGRQDLLDDAQLGVSELVTNACLHARSVLTVDVVADPAGEVRIEVGDRSPLIPQMRPSGPLGTTGRGLDMLEALGRWGVDRDPAGGKIIWFVPRGDDGVVRPAPSPQGLVTRRDR